MGNPRSSLAKDQDNAVVGGVCAGISRYLDIDPTLVRAMFIASVALGGFGPAVYVALWILLADEDSVCPLREPDRVRDNNLHAAGPITSG